MLPENLGAASWALQRGIPLPREESGCSAGVTRHLPARLLSLEEAFQGKIARVPFFSWEISLPAHIPGSPGANEFVPVSCHHLPHRSTSGHKAARGVAKALQRGVLDLWIWWGEQGGNFFFFNVCVSRGLWCRALAFIPVFRFWIYLVILLVVFTSPLSLPPAFSFPSSPLPHSVYCYYKLLGMKGPVSYLKPLDTIK